MLHYFINPNFDVAAIAFFFSCFEYILFYHDILKTVWNPLKTRDFSFLRNLAI